MTDIKVGDKIRFVADNSDNYYTHGKIYTCTKVLDLREERHSRRELFYGSINDEGNQNHKYAYKWEKIQADLLPEELFIL